MAWTAPVTRATGYVVLAADWNNEHVSNLQYLHGDAGSFQLNNAAVGYGFLVNSPGGGGVGYLAGVGAIQGQTVSRNTALTINNICGQIVTQGASLANGATAIFTVNNSTVAATDTIVLNVQNNALGASQMIPIVSAVAAGSFQISYTNTSGAATTSALNINFAVIKAAQT